MGISGLKRTLDRRVSSIAWTTQKVQTTLVVTGSSQWPFNFLVVTPIDDLFPSRKIRTQSFFSVGLYFYIIKIKYIQKVSFCPVMPKRMYIFFSAERTLNSLILDL